MKSRKLEIVDDGSKTKKLRGIVARAGIPNANGLVYPKDVLEKALNEFCENGYVTFDPNFDDGKINLQHVAGVPINFNFDEGGDVFLEVRLMELPAGKRVMDIIGSHGFSLSGMGSLGLNDTVKDDYKIVKVDFAPLEILEEK